MIPAELLLENGAISKKVEAGEIIYLENSHSTFYYQVLSGKVRISNYLDDGKEVLHKIVCPNDGFGEVAIFVGGAHLVTAVAETACILLRISATSYMDIMNRHPVLLLVVIQQIAKDLRFKIFMTKLICNHNPEDIIYNLLQKLNEDRKLICHECNRLMLTRQQLANMTGLRVETIIRTMKQMEKEDKLNIVKGKVFVPSDGMG